MATRKKNARERRARLGDEARRTSRSSRGKTTTRQTPLTIRADGPGLTSNVREYIATRAGFKLGKFAPRIRSVVLRLTDESGPTGAPMCGCALTVALDGAGGVVVRRRAPTPRESIDGALEIVERAVRRRLQRQRSTALARHYGRQSS